MVLYLIRIFWICHSTKWRRAIDYVPVFLVKLFRGVQKGWAFASISSMGTPFRRSFGSPLSLAVAFPSGECRRPPSARLKSKGHFLCSSKPYFSIFRWNFEDVETLNLQDSAIVWQTRRSLFTISESPI